MTTIHVTETHTTHVYYSPLLKMTLGLGHTLILDCHRSALHILQCVCVDLVALSSEL